MKLSFVLAATMVWFVAAGAADAQAGRQALLPGACAPPAGTAAAPRQSSVDMGGVTLGMSPEQARKALTCRTGPYTLRNEQGSVRIGQRFANVPYIQAQRGPGLPTRGQPASERISINFAGAPGRERVVRIVKQVSFADDNQANFDALWAEFDRHHGAFLAGTRPSNKSRAAIVRTPQGAPLSPSDQSYDLCSSFGLSYSSALDTLSARYAPMPNCGKIVTHSIKVDTGDPTRATGYTVGMLDYGQAIAAINEALSGASPLSSSSQSRTAQQSRAAPQACYAIRKGLEQCRILAEERCLPACVNGGPPQRQACRATCETQRNRCEADARRRATELPPC